MPNKQFGVFCPVSAVITKKIRGSKTRFPEIGNPDPEASAEGGKKIIIVKLDAVGDVLRDYIDTAIA